MNLVINVFGHLSIKDENSITDTDHFEFQTFADLFEWCNQKQIKELRIMKSSFMLYNDLFVELKRLQKDLVIIPNGFSISFNDKLIELLKDNRQNVLIEINVKCANAICNSLFSKRTDMSVLVTYCIENDFRFRLIFDYNTFDPAEYTKIKPNKLKSKYKANPIVNYLKSIRYETEKDLFGIYLSMQSNNEMLNEYIKTTYPNDFEFVQTIFAKIDQNITNGKQSRLNTAMQIARNASLSPKYDYEDAYSSLIERKSYAFKKSYNTKEIFTNHEQIIAGILGLRYLFSDEYTVRLPKKIVLKDVYLIDQLPKHPFLSYDRTVYQNGIASSLLKNEPMRKINDGYICSLFSNSVSPKYLFNSLPIQINNAGIIEYLKEYHVLHLDEITLNFESINNENKPTSYSYMIQVGDVIHNIPMIDIKGEQMKNSIPRDERSDFPFPFFFMKEINLFGIASEDHNMYYTYQLKPY